MKDHPNGQLRRLAATGRQPEHVKSWPGSVPTHMAPTLASPWPGAMELPEAVFFTAAITNSASDIQRPVLRVLALDGLFDEIVISGEVGIAKPDPGIFAIAIKRLGVDPARAWHVGDSLARDVAGAKAAGLRAVWLNRTGAARRDDDPEPDWEIASLAELLPFVSEEFKHPAQS